MNMTKKLIVGCQVASLIAMGVVGVELLTLHRAAASLAAERDQQNGVVTTALAMAADYASRTCSGAAGDQRVDVLVGQTIVTPSGEKLTCTRDRVLIYSHV